MVDFLIRLRSSVLKFQAEYPNFYFLNQTNPADLYKVLYTHTQTHKDNFQNIIILIKRYDLINKSSTVGIWTPVMHGNINMVSA